MASPRAHSTRGKQAASLTDDEKIDSISVAARTSDEQGQRLPQAAFWAPRHTAPSPALCQLPLMLWLTGVTAPRVTLQLGLGDGLCYLTICQVVERLNAGNISFAITEQGNPRSSEIQEEHDRYYSDFSQILSKNEVMESLLGAAEVDLLVVNGAIESNMLRSLRNIILHQLSGEAVIILLEPDIILEDDSVSEILDNKSWRRVDFRPTTPEGVSIAIISPSENPPAELSKLFDQRLGQRAWLATRQAFNRLGQGVNEIENSRLLKAENDILKHDLNHNKKRLEALQSEVDKAEASEKIALELNARLAAQVHDIEKQAEAETVKREELLSALALLEAERNKLADDIKLMSDHNRSMANEIENLKVENETLATERDKLKNDVGLLELANGEREAAREAESQGRSKEIEVLRKDLEKARQDHDDRLEDIANLTSEFLKENAELSRKLTLERDDIFQHLKAAEAHREALLASTSWKITSPMRKVKNALKKRG
ncbi:MAG: hypothetical protein Q4G36_04305 [Paracoccus sp. (in: a-proteobacteria)]|nr:hypothetical protein [Paracoccus sp. (in: a-proteobacteria)]